MYTFFKALFTAFVAMKNTSEKFFQIIFLTFIDKNFQIEPMDLKSKEAVALDIINKIIQYYDA